MYKQDFFCEKERRKNKIIEKMQSLGVEAILINDNANLYYTSGRIFSGYTYIDILGNEIFFVKRPINLNGNDVEYIHKPELICERLSSRGLQIPKTIGLELDSISYNLALRITAVFNNPKIINVSNMMKAVRSVKTPYEIGLIKESGIHHVTVYRHIKKLFREGISDIELQIEIERQNRLNGSLGIFRISGQSMEIFSGSVLVGKNADTPSPYDFAMGGAGLDYSLPVGANGTIIKPGNSIMVDMCGNFTGYMTDMTRVYYTEYISEVAVKAHNLSIEIAKKLALIGKPGVKASDLYAMANKMAEDAGLAEYFRGHKQKSQFIGHGVGIEINELPVIAQRSKDILKVGNVIAIEPKFVIPEVGAVGIENTYVVTDTGMECLTNLEETITKLN